MFRHAPRSARYLHPFKSYKNIYRDIVIRVSANTETDEDDVCLATFVAFLVPEVTVLLVGSGGKSGCSEAGFDLNTCCLLSIKGTVFSSYFRFIECFASFVSLTVVVSSVKEKSKDPPR